MAYRFEQRESVTDGLRRIAGEQIGKAIAELYDSDLDHHETVHQFRKRGKKIRGLIRLVRPALGGTYEQENRWFRDEARRLSRVRDAEALIETVDALRTDTPSNKDGEILNRVREQLTRRRQQIADEWVDLNDALEDLAIRLQSAKQRVADWRLDGSSFDAIAGGLQKTYRRGRRAFLKARRRRSSKRLHEWRKRTKYHWYHMRLLRDVWKPVLMARINELDRLSDLLGDDHDLAVFRQTLLRETTSRFGTPEDIERLMGLMHQRRCQLQRDAYCLGGRILAEKPRQLVRRCEAYWSFWRDGGTAEVGSEVLCIE